MDNTDHQPTQAPLRKYRRFLLIAGPVMVLCITGIVYLMGGRYVSTDDAYIRSARTEISSTISARVTEIAVKDNQYVHQGDLLFKLDDRDLIIAVEEANAKLASTKLRVIALKATYRQRQMDVKIAENTVAYRKHELERQQKLAKQGVSSQAQLDQAKHEWIVAEQKQNVAEQEKENVRVSLNNNPDMGVNHHPSVLQAQAELDKAKLMLSYATIKAPVDGIVSKVDQLQTGDFIKAATPVFALISNKVWVEANFKETDLNYMHIGQAAIITIDAYPDKRFHGQIVSLSPGTGSSFSLLPPENASGNWVKVVQRLPVRISLDHSDPQHRLHAGLSVTVEVDTHHSRLADLSTYHVHF